MYEEVRFYNSYDPQLQIFYLSTNMIIGMETARHLVLSDDTIRTWNFAQSLLRPQLPCVISDPLEYDRN